MKKLIQSRLLFFIFGAISSAPLFGVYMYFGPIILIMTLIISLVSNEDSLKELGRMFSFIFGAMLGWAAMYFLWIKH
jgi:hypothetical protein